MEKNQTAVIEFYFVGLTDHFPDKMILFLIFLFVYLVTLGGNLGMVALIWTDSRLHTPMYFFLSHLSLVDIGSSSSIAPKMLSDIFLKRKVISFMGCAVQMWFIGQFAVTECFLLAAMACDRYIAICNPLLYPVIMSQKVCVQLVAAPYVMGILNAIIQETFTFCLPFCGPNVVNHFFCDILPVLSLACADTQNNRLVLFIMAGGIVLFSGMIITISSSVAPKMLSDIFPERKVISFMGCAVQMWFIVQFAVTECFLLAAMACDRYIAICNPLLYPVIMSQKVCVQLVAAPYVMGILNAIIQETFTFCLPFCGPNVVNHIFCDILPVLSLACADTQNNRLVLFIMAGAIVLFSGMIITISYVYILVAILKIQTANGRQKAFSTCSSHLIAICILYGSLFSVYIFSESGSSLNTNKVISLFYTVVIPMLNPLIYSVRNKEVKSVFWSKFERKIE